ncbi:hypothetical protein K504DRAFT_295407 [Pleomassaria siparia CBS 279.74]|uniref:Uncharacterized protein n=1 Tax=Pleomassaria siparia CBS 279.74 TaxID=1314801 RepID=A0A6G1K8G0_9PLEO|nr:hypothetical protein K504DRAFT_295407 [Pleomassaria siparia CBS 279.74]
MARTLLGRRQLEAAQRGQQGADKLAHLQQQGERIHEDDEVRESVEDVTQQKGEVAIQAALQAEVKEQTQVPKPSNATTMQPERCESTKSDEAAHMALKKLADKERLRRAQEDAIRRQSDRMQKRIKVNDEKRTKIEEQEAKRMKLTLRNAVGMDHTAQTAVAMAPEKKTQTTTTTTTTRKTWKILEQVTPAGLQRNQAATTIPAKKPARKSSRISKRRQTKSVARPSEHAGFGGKSPRSIEPTNFHALDEAGKKAYRMALLRGKISDQQAREDLMKREVIWVATRHASPEVLGKGLELFRKAHEKDIPRAVKRGMKVAHLLLSYFHVLQELENGHVGAATSEGSGRTQVKAGLPATSDEPSQLSATSTIGAGGISNSSLVAAQPAKTPRKTAPARSSKRNGPTEPALVFLPPSSTPTSQPLPDPAPAQNLVFVQVRSDEAKMGLVAGTNSMGRPKRRSAVAADQARREHNVSYSFLNHPRLISLFFDWPLTCPIFSRPSRFLRPLPRSASANPPSAVTTVPPAPRHHVHGQRGCERASLSSYRSGPQTFRPYQHLSTRMASVPHGTMTLQ